MESAARLPLCSHLLQHTLRGVCVESEWMYCVFWRILPRNFPPPKWELGGYLERSKANKRNWILAWEDGFCDFTRSAAASGVELHEAASNKKSEEQVASRRLHPELFFKMSHEIYNYGEGLMGKIAADNGHKWIYRDPPERDNRLVSFWHNTIDPQPKIWDAQFKSGIQTIVVVAVREGLVQLGSTRQVLEDVNFVMLLQRKFNSLQQAYIDPMQQQPPNLATVAALQTCTMLPPADQILHRVLKRVGRPDDGELEPGVTRTLERRLSWSSCHSSVRPGFHRLDLPLDNKYSVSSFNTLQQNDQLISLPLAHDVQTAADHLSLNATQLLNSAAATAPTVSTSQCSGVITSVGYQNPCNLGINSSLQQGDLSTSANSVSTTTLSNRQCNSNSATAVEYAARRSVLPCISNDQALLSHQLIIRPSTNSPASAPATSLMHQQHHINMVHENLSARLPSPSSPVSSGISVRPVATSSFSASTASTSPQRLDEAATASKSSDLQPATLLTSTSGQQHPSTTTSSTCSPARPARLLQQHRELHKDGLADARKFTAVLTIVESGSEAAHDYSPHQQSTAVPAAHSSDI
ncbi:hypothetical protein L7F22_067680 [Adiantum nelumboides]|nr:hypothetical protein [Adiantum nelumboides]